MQMRTFLLDYSMTRFVNDTYHVVFHRLAKYQKPVILNFDQRMS